MQLKYEDNISNGRLLVAIWLQVTYLPMVLQMICSSSTSAAAAASVPADGCEVTLSPRPVRFQWLPNDL